MKLSSVKIKLYSVLFLLRCWSLTSREQTSESLKEQTDLSPPLCSVKPIKANNYSL